jgi:hypothetical protein
MEKVLVTWDWAEAFVALNLVAKPAVEESVLRKLGESGRHNGDTLLGRVNTNVNAAVKLLSYANGDHTRTVCTY